MPASLVPLLPVVTEATAAVPVEEVEVRTISVVLVDDEKECVAPAAVAVRAPPRASVPPIETLFVMATAVPAAENVCAPDQVGVPAQVPLNVALDDVSVPVTVRV